MGNKPILQSIAEGDLSYDSLCAAISFKGKEREGLFRLARQRRSEYFPSEEVEIRSVIEISNICQRKCNFCNINFYPKGRKRYIIGREELIKITEHIYYKNRRVILIQSGENRSQKYIDHVSKCVSSMKRKFKDLIIILCLGNLSRNQYRQLRTSGADRYILKFETSSPGLYRQIKPDSSLEERIACINLLIESGFDVGTGNIIGLPNQGVKDIIDDLLFIANFKLTMASSSIFIPGENSAYRHKPAGDFDIILNYMALMRIIYPWLLIPSTSSLEKIRKGGQYSGLMAGANTVTIHDGTPAELKKYFPIYSINRFIPNEKHTKDIVVKSGLHFK
jgi:biotin synthase